MKRLFCIFIFCLLFSLFTQTPEINASKNWVPPFPPLASK
jgi:hypothetical protein